MRTAFFCIWFCGLTSALFCQVADSGRVAHSPKKAILMSALLPGLGQAYNHKYLKIPVIYAAGGYLVYNVLKNNSQYQQFRDGYRLISDTGLRISSVLISGVPYNGLQCKANRDLFRRQRDLNVFAVLLVYTLNLIDANVDAHLFDFNMSDDLSAQILTNLEGTGYPGLSLKLCLK